MRSIDVWRLTLLMSILFLSGSSPFLSQNTVRAHTPYPATIKDTPTGHVTILVLDMSGSMADNDQNQVRCDAAKAFIDLSGPGNMIGLIGMAGAKAQIWHDPLPTDVLTQRMELKRAITDRPPLTPDCQHPSGNTPTADALLLAWQMLNNEPGLQGSVILLSDGVPTPDTDGDIATIQKKLLPLFQQKHWPVDTIALGTQGVLRPFLVNISRQTGGIPYDDAQGPVPGERSSLNILPFFTDILSRQTGGSFATLASLTTITSGITSYNFQVDATDKGLYLLLIRDTNDQGGVQARLLSPGPAPLVLSASRIPPGADYDQNNSYAAFTVGNLAPSPGNLQAGTWELDVSGTGRFEAVLLKSSWLQVAFLSPSQNAALLNIDQPFRLTTTIVDARSPDLPLRYPGLTLTASVAYRGTPDQAISAFTTQQYTLVKGPDPQTYQATLHLPTYASEGIYTLTVAATGVTGVLISENTETLRLFHFPTVVLASYQAVEYQWPGWVTRLYSLPLLDWLGARVLPSGQARLTGKIQVNNAPYPAVKITQVTLISPTGQKSQPEIVNENQGSFQFNFPNSPPGQYTLSLSLNGAFAGFKGNLGETTLNIQLSSIPATNEMLIGLIGLTLVLALLFLAMVIGLYQLETGTKPFGGCKNEETNTSYDFSSARRRFGPGRNRPRSERVRDSAGETTSTFLPGGLRFRFYRKIPLLRPNGYIKARLCGKDGKYWSAWYKNKLQPLSHWRYHKVSSLTYESFIDRKRSSRVLLKKYTVLFAEESAEA
ncbi:MAG TPA: vWA domain-containing protein [Ktedonobacteraceae bacterium]|nr:vWA domain-containing protein [Ktedonobacteraceae bacterium]